MESCLAGKIRQPPATVTGPDMPVRWFFGFVALTEALDVVDTLIKGDGHLQSLGLEYLPRIGIFILLCAVAATTRNLRFHAPFVFAAFAHELSFFGRYYATLNEATAVGWNGPAAPEKTSSVLSPV